MTTQTAVENAVHPRLDERFITNIKGKDFVLYSGLLDLAHQKGIQSIHVEAIQYPTTDNGMEAICKAVVRSEDGKEFGEISDANPKNVNKMIKEHILRMAATRAKARALRDYTNIGMTCIEELGDLDKVIGTTKSKTKSVKSTPKKDVKANEKQVKANSPKAAQKANPAKEKAADQQAATQSNVTPFKPGEPKMSNAQKRAILNLAQRRGIAEDELMTMVEDAFNSDLDYLSSNQAGSLIRQLQQAA